MSSKKRDEHTQYILSHKLDAFKHTHRTTLRIDSLTWEAFKQHCSQYGVTTCFIVRSLIHEWLKTSPARHTAVEYQHWEYLKEITSLVKVDKKGKIIAKSL